MVSPRFRLLDLMLSGLVSVPAGSWPPGTSMSTLFLSSVAISYLLRLWPLAFGRWPWPLAFGLWSLVFGLWFLAFGFWFFSGGRERGKSPEHSPDHFSEHF